jgi:hypothetical protein
VKENKLRGVVPGKFRLVSGPLFRRATEMRDFLRKWRVMRLDWLRGGRCEEIPRRWLGWIPREDCCHVKVSRGLWIILGENLIRSNVNRCNHLQESMLYPRYDQTCSLLSAHSEKGEGCRIEESWKEMRMRSWRHQWILIICAHI